MAGVLKPAFDARIINCVVCHEPQPTPWCTCTTCSALICTPCVVKLRNVSATCPLCRQVLVWKHNVFAEHIAAQYIPFTVPCGHAGCNAEVPFDTLAAHRGVCVSRPRPCPTGKKCPFTGSPKEIIAHLGSAHNAIPLDAIPTNGTTLSAAFQVSVPRIFTHSYYYVALDFIDGLIFIENNSFPIEGYAERTIVTDMCTQTYGNHIIVASGERVESRVKNTFNFRIYEYKGESNEYSGFGIVASYPGPSAKPWSVNITVTNIVRAKTERDDVCRLVEQPDTKKTRGNEDEEKKRDDVVYEMK